MGKRMIETVTEEKTIYKGVNETARRLGISCGHLSMILHGHRLPGKRLARKLEHMGIKVGPQGEIKA